MHKFKVSKKKKAKHISVARQHTERSVRMTVYLEANWPYNETEESQIAKCACGVMIAIVIKSSETVL